MLMLKVWHVQTKNLFNILSHICEKFLFPLSLVPECLLHVTREIVVNDDHETVQDVDQRVLLAVDCIKSSSLLMWSFATVLGRRVERMSFGKSHQNNNRGFGGVW